MKCFVKFCGNVIFWAVIVFGLVVGAALVLVMRHLDEAVRAEVQKVFAAHYHDLHVAVRSAQRVEGQGIYIRGLSVKDPTLPGPQGELLYVDEIFLQCPSGIDDLVLRDVKVQHITLRRLALRAVRRADGSWSVARLMPLPKFGGEKMPVAIVEDATVEIFDPNRTPASSLTLRRINLSIEPQQVAVAAGAAATHSSVASRSVLHVRGNAASDVFDRTEIDGWLDPASGQWEAQGTATELVVSPEMRQALPESLSQHLTSLGNLRGAANLGFHVRNVQTGLIPYEFDVRGKLAQGELEDVRLPFPLTGIAADIHASNTGLEITNLRAQGAGAALSLSLTRHGWLAASPVEIDLRARRLLLSPELKNVLPAEMGRVWQQFQPAGLVDVDLALVFDGERWQPTAAVRALSASFIYEKFPYPLTDTTGSIALHDDVLTFGLRSLAGTTGVQMSGRIDDVRGAKTGWFEFACEGPVPLDERLLAAFDTPKLAKAKEIIASLKARGSATVSGRFERLTPEQTTFSEHLLISVSDAAIEYAKFPYPLSRITGEIEVRSGEWAFRNFQGRNDSGHVTGQGFFGIREEKPLLALDFIAIDVPLEDELREALPLGAQRAWNELRPRGTIDRLDIALRYRPHLASCTVDVAAQKWPEQPNSKGQPISLFPVAFPYRLNRVEGAARYSAGKIEFTQVRAEHGKAKLTSSGFWQPVDEGGWRLQFSQLAAEELPLDRDLVTALPTELSTALSKLSVGGPLMVGGAIEFRTTAKPEEGVACDWDLSFDLENGRVLCGIGLDNIHGSVRLMGNKTGTNFFSRGELAVDSLMYHGFQLTEITGPLWIDRERVAFGAWAEKPQPGRRPRRVQAKLLGGTIASDIQIAMDADRNFTLQSHLEGADLTQLAREMLPRQRAISGSAGGMLRLSGNCQGSDTLRGEGKLWLREADIYELPVMVALLKILSIRKPLDTTAFTSSDTDFRINGENVYLDRIVLDGDAISLRGTGEVGFDRSVHLNFYTLVGSEARRLPLVWPLLADASRRILMIEITGTLDDPVTTRHVLPGLNSTLQQLFSEELTGMPPNSAAGPPRASDRRSSLPR